MQGCRERNAAPLSPRPSGRAALIDTFTFRVVSAVGPATAAISRKSLSRLARLMVVEVNLPPFAAASHTISNSCGRDLARMIASLVALSAANIRLSRSFCSSVFCFSSTRSKLSRANETFSASLPRSSTRSSVNAASSQERKRSTPTALSPFFSKGKLAPDRVPSCLARACQ